MAITTGFDPELVTSTIQQIKDSYFKLIDEIPNNLQTQFVDKMAAIWGCKEAQTFFSSKFKPAFDGIIKSIYSNYDEVIKQVNAAAAAWANRTDTSWSNISFKPGNKYMDTSMIQENINGVRGIDEEAANQIASSIITIANAAKDALGIANSAVRGKDAFIGKDQQASLCQRIGKMATNIGDTSTQMSDEVKKEINNTVERYSQLEKDVSNAFEVDVNNIDFSQIYTNAKDAANGENAVHAKEEYWGDTTNGKITAEVRDDGTVLFKEDGVAMGFTTQDALNDALSKQNSASQSTQSNSEVHYDNWDKNHEYGYTSGENNNSTTQNSTSQPIGKQSVEVTDR